MRPGGTVVKTRERSKNAGDMACRSPNCPFTAGDSFAIKRPSCRAEARTIHNNCDKTDKPLQVIVHDNNVDQAMRVLKKKMQREGVFREMKLRRFSEKPSERRAREQAAAVRRARKLERKRAERDNRS